MTRNTNLRRQWIYLLVLIPFLIFPATVGSAQTRKLTLREAQELARAALSKNARTFKHIRFDAYNGYPGRLGFYWFEVTGSVPDNASPILGHFAVSQATGDVWNPVSCRKLASLDLENLQRKMRKRIHLSDQDLDRLSGEAPCEP
jgi:hypothetical protein